MVTSRPPVFAFVGDDSYRKESALKELSSSILDDASRELNYRVFYGDELDTSGMMDFASTVPFLSPSRLVIIKGFERIPKKEKARIVEYLKNPSKHTCVVIEAETEEALAGYDIEGHISIRRFFTPRDDEMVPWIMRFVAEKGKRIMDEAASMVKELAGCDSMTVARELEKLIAYTGDRMEITGSDVEETVGRTLAVSAFDITDAVGQKRPDRALGIASDLAMGGTKQYEIIGILCWHIKRMLKARVLLNKGLSQSHVAASLRIARRHSASFFRQVNGFKENELKRKMEILLEADLNIKRTRYDPALVLEFAIIRLCLGASTDLSPTPS